ncbi:hypothetical protein JMF89_17725 [Clostridiaceae bacterium UIB06]|nr:hypothetical protein [Clostridiaceae bacterium UIB06]
MAILKRFIRIISHGQKQKTRWNPKVVADAIAIEKELRKNENSKMVLAKTEPLLIEKNKKLSSRTLKTRRVRGKITKSSRYVLNGTSKKIERRATR